MSSQSTALSTPNSPSPGIAFRWYALYLGLAAGVVLAINGTILFTFGKMFEEQSLVLPPLTQFYFDYHWHLLVAILCLLPMYYLTNRRGRGFMIGLATILTACFVLLLARAMFMPLVELVG